MNKADSSSIRAELELTTQKFPGCRACGSAHPIVLGSDLDPHTCPGCGAPVRPPEAARVVPARVPGLAGLFAAVCFGIAGFLSRQLEKMT